MNTDLISRLMGLGAMMTVDLPIIPNDASEVCFLAAQEIADLQAQIAEAHDAARRLADELTEAEQAMRDEIREVEFRAKEDGFRAGQNGGYF